jgi:hypothetical protein
MEYRIDEELNYKSCLILSIFSTSGSLNNPLDVPLCPPSQEAFGQKAPDFVGLTEFGQIPRPDPDLVAGLEWHQRQLNVRTAQDFKSTDIGFEVQVSKRLDLPVAGDKIRLIRFNQRSG